MDRAREISEATLGLLFQNYYITLALLGIVLVFALYVYLYRRPFLSEYFAAAEKKEAPTEKKETATTATA